MKEFLDYRFSERPSLFLRAMTGAIPPDRLALPTLEHEISRAFADINATLDDDTAEPAVKGFALHGIQATDGLIEVIYQLEHRVDLVGPDLRPRTEYSTTRGAIWIDAEHRMCLINASHLNDATQLASALAGALDVAEVQIVTLTKELTEGIVDEANIRTGVFIRDGGQGTGPSSIRFGDRELASHARYRELRDGGHYRSTYGYYRLQTMAPGLPPQLGIGLTRRSGRFWIPYSLSRTELATVARWVMRVVGNRRAGLFAGDLSAAIATQDATLAAHLPPRWRRQETREAILSLLPALIRCLRDEVERAPIECNPMRLAQALGRDLLAIAVEGSCEHCHADMVLICKRCGDTRIAVMDDGEVLKCCRCNARWESGASLFQRCECGSLVALTIDHHLTLYPTNYLREGIDLLLQVIDVNLRLERHAFVIEGRELRLLRDRTAPRVLQLEDIDEFDQPNAIGAYPGPVHQTVRRRLANGAGKEKCAGVKSTLAGVQRLPCDTCSLRPHPDRECLRTIVVDRLGTRKIEPHVGTEIADLAFDVTVDGRQFKVLAFGK